MDAVNGITQMDIPIMVKAQIMVAVAALILIQIQVAVEAIIPIKMAEIIMSIHITLIMI